MPNLVLGYTAKETAKQRFRSFNITLPATPSTAIEALHKPSLRSALLPAARTSQLTQMQFPPALFRAASSSSADVGNQKSMHDLFNDLFDGIIDAIEFGFNLYRQTAGLVDVQVMAVQATGGRLEGPPLDGLIARSPSVAAWGGVKAAVLDAVAKGMQQQWSAVARSVKVSGLPWYPAFAAFPAPVAPPMPNTPTPFIALTHDYMATSPQNLKTAMRSALHGNIDYSAEFFESVATSFQTPLQVWKMQQFITQVLGTGPVPTFAPPYIPVGPVVGGSTLPGHHINT